MTKHDIPLGTKVGFEGDSIVYITSDYTDIVQCDDNCELNHEHFTEPHISVKKEVRTLKPLGKLRYIFDQNDVGHPY